MRDAAWAVSSINQRLQSCNPQRIEYKRSQLLVVAVQGGWLRSEPTASDARRTCSYMQVVVVV